MANSAISREQRDAVTLTVLGLVIGISWLSVGSTAHGQSVATDWFDLQGRLEADFLATAQSPANEAIFGNLGEAVGIRRAWLGAEGRFDWGRVVTLLDLASGEVVIRDLFVGSGEVRDFGEIRFGHFLEPLSLEVNTASFTFAFMECSVASVFAPARNWGLNLFRLNEPSDTSLSLGVFQAGSDPNDLETGPGSNWGLTGRFTATPLYEEDQWHWLHLGVALSARLSEKGTIVLNQQPQTPLLGLGDVASSPFVPQIVIPAGFQHLANLQFAAAHHSNWLQAEWYGSWIDQMGGAPVFFHGMYVAGGWFVTGEHRTYNPATGALGIVRVNRPFLFQHDDCERECGWGAWEVTARFAYLDAQDADTPRGPGGQLVGISLPEFTFGVNWYVSDHIRLMGNYSCAIPEEPNTGGSLAHIFGMRLGCFW